MVMVDFEYWADFSTLNHEAEHVRTIFIIIYYVKFYQIE